MVSIADFLKMAHSKIEFMMLLAKSLFCGWKPN